MAGVRQAFIGAGANLGDRERTLHAAMAALGATPGIQRVVTSHWYETDPVGVTDQPAFLNLVIGVDTTLSPEELLRTLLQIEQRFGRVRTVRWGPRTLDLDLLAFEGETRETPELILPHPRLLERGFVVVPLRGLLQHPHFAGPTWRVLRTAVDAVAVDAAGVREYRVAGDAAAMRPVDPAITAYLVGLKRCGVSFGLERMQALLAALGSPQNATPVIHVAGTNGKGSVAAMIEAILRQAGWKTGLYTSPHLVHVGERVQVNRQPLNADVFERAVQSLQPTVAALVERGGPEARPTYFEFLTALAFRRFAEEACDIAIIEVGMGGRLDATNVVTPLVSVITSIGLDHTAFLGDTIEAIAGEKAGIIKPTIPVVLGRLPPAAERVVRTTARELGAPVHSVVEEFGEAPSGYPETNLPGEYQRTNAATAVLVARQLPERWRVTPEIISAALARVSWEGRWQRLTVGGRIVIVDTSHNEEGAVSLDRELARLTAAEGRPAIVVGVLGESRAGPLLETACRHAARLYLVVPQQRRACPYDVLAALVPASFAGEVSRATVAALFPVDGPAVPGLPAGVPVVVTGSIALAGEVLARLEPARGAAEPELQDF